MLSKIRLLTHCERVRSGVRAGRRRHRAGVVAAWLAAAAAGPGLSPCRAVAQPAAEPVRVAPLVERMNFHGRVIESDTGAPVADAVIMVTCVDAASDPTLDPPWNVWRDRIKTFKGQGVQGEQIVTRSDARGAFGFRSLPPGRVEIRVAAMDCQAFTATGTIRAGEILEAEYAVHRMGRSDGYQVVVSGRRELKGATRERLTVTEVERLPGFGGDVIKSVQSLPGVARPAMADPAAIVVRGSGQFDTRYVLDGVDIPLLFHYGGVKSTYNSLALASVDLYPGGFGTRYGGCVGGVMEVRGRGAQMDRWRRAVDVSLLDASFHAEGPLGGGFGLLLTGRRSYAGELVRAALSSQDDMKFTMAPYYADFVARLDRGTSPDDRFFVTLFGVKDRMELIFPDGAEGSPEVNEATDAVDMDLAYSRLILGYDRRIGDHARNELRAAYGRSSEVGHVLGYFDFRSSGPYYQLRDELSANVRPELTAHLGADVAYTPIDYRVTALGWPTSKRRIGFSDTGAYAAVDWRPAPGIQITPGVRYDHYAHLHEGRASFRLTSRYDVRANHSVTAAVGTYNQPPQPIGQTTDPVYGNPGLPPTRATHFTVGDAWRIDERTSLKVESYYNVQRDIPAMTDSLDLNFVPDAEGRMYGIELMLRRDQKQGGRFFGWVSYGISKSERRYARRPLGEQASPLGGASGASGAWDADRWWPFAYDQTHHLEAVGSWGLGNNWTAGGRAQYTTGNPTTPIRNLDGTFEWDADTGDYREVSGEYMSDRMAPYVRFDARVEKKIVRKASTWSVYLDVQNLNYFLYNSPESYRYNYDYSRREEYGWIILPALGCRVEF